MHPEIKAAVNQIEELVRSRDKRINDIERLTRENADNIGALIATGGGNPSRPDRDEVLAQARAFYSAVQRRPVADQEIDLEALEKYGVAFRNWLRRGDAIPMEFKAAMSVGSDPDGGFWAPPQLSRTLISRMFDDSPLREIAGGVTITAGALEIPIDPNDATSGGWVGEKQARSVTASPQVGLQRIEVHEQYAQPEVTQSLLDDAFFDIEAWLNAKIAGKLLREENDAFVSGDGVMKPKGFLAYKDTAVTTDDGSRSWGLLQYIPTGAAGAFPTVSGSTAHDPDCLITTIGKLKTQYRANARWVMNRETAALVRKLKDADGRYLWVDGLREGEADRLLGYPVTLLEGMPDVAVDSFSIAFGDFRRGFLIVDRMGFRLLRDPFSNKPYVRFYTTRRVGSDVVDFDAIKLIKFAAS